MRTRRLKNEINVVPYIDVMLVLLVIFMVAAPMMTTGSVDLPTTGKSSQVPSNPTRVLVNADGSIAIKDAKGNEERVDKAGLASYLSAEQAKNPNWRYSLPATRTPVTKRCLRCSTASSSSTSSASAWRRFASNDPDTPGGQGKMEVAGTGRERSYRPRHRAVCRRPVEKQEAGIRRGGTLG